MSYRTSDSSPHSRTADALDAAGVITRIDDALRDIDFAEVTLEDRITFIRAAVSFHVESALQRGRFGTAVALRRFETERIAALRGIMPHGAVTTPRPE